MEENKNTQTEGFLIPEGENSGEEEQAPEERLPTAAEKRRAKTEKRENRARFIFITEMIAHGNRVKAYQTAYPDASAATARVNACRLLGDSHVVRQIHAGLMATRELLTEMFQTFYENALAADQEKREILAKIMRGQLEFDKEVAKTGGKVTVKLRPDMKDVLRAIALDNEMAKDWINVFEFPVNKQMF